MVNWQSAKTKIQNLIENSGIVATWLQRTVDTSSAYNTGSETTFGYGDPIINYTTGSITGIIDHMRADEVMLDAGFYIEDYEKFYVDPDSVIAAWDQIILPDNNEKYVVISVHTFRVSASSISLNNLILSKYLTLRRLVPRDVNTY
jgi:hypothetical protein